MSFQLKSWSATAFACLSMTICSVGAAVDAQCELTLRGNKTQFQMGEPVRLAMKIVTKETHYFIDESSYPGLSPNDILTLTPSAGAYKWSADRARFEHYQNDWVSIDALTPEKPFKKTITVNSVYRIDSPGHYIVHITTKRVILGDPQTASQPPSNPQYLTLTCNDVGYDVLPMPSAREASIASSIEQRARSTPDVDMAQRIANKLEYLAGDASTKVKLSLYLNPVIVDGRTTNVTTGLWIARNRPMVVSALERAIVDPGQKSSVNMDMLNTLVALKSSLLVPYDPLQPSALTPEERLSAGYIHQIATSIPRRNGEPGIDAARTVFVWMASNDQARGRDFDVAREYLITHFSEVDPYNVDWLLNQYGMYLRDRRMIPALKHIIETTTGRAYMGPTATAASKQLTLIP